MNQIMSGAEPFLFPGGKTGCLLIHGYTGTPREMRLLGAHLAGEGHTVLGIRLFAHGTRPQDMFRARWRDWVASVEDGFDLLKGVCDRVVVMGLSMGGVLSLIAAARYAVTGVVAMSTPYYAPDPRIRPLRPLIPLASLFWRYGPKGESDWHDPQAAIGHLDYPQSPIRSVAELNDLILEMQRSLAAIRVPLLLIHSHGDRTLPADHATQLFAQVGSKDKELMWVEDSGHVITCDAEREKVFAAAAAFVRRMAGVSA
jgi:carboxylesterase